MIENKRILITGGAGYIGSHSVKALARAGYEPVVYDNLVYGHSDAVQWGDFEQGDILDADRLGAVIRKYQPALVMHFAAFAYVGESVTDPAKYYKNNLVGSLSLLDTMLANDVKNIIFSSTCATYGVPANLPITDNTAQAPINAYGFTKLAIERALADYAHAYGLRYAIMRYFNAAGADPEGDLGERHDPETHAIPLAILGALGRGPAFRVFGTDYNTPDGTAIRDYVHVSDLADAHVRAVPYLLTGGANAAFNLATGRATSVAELLAAVERATGRPVPTERSLRRDGDPPALYASAEKARDILGWKPQFLEIDEIVSTAVHWFIRGSDLTDRPTEDETL